METLRAARVAVALVCAALVLVGCGSSDDADNTSDTTEPSADASGSDSDAEESSNTDSDTDVVELDAERVADLAALRIERPTSTGDAIIGIVETFGEFGSRSTSLVRVGLDGTVSAPVPVPDNVSIYDLYATSAGVFANGSSYEPAGGGTACGYAPVDVETLTVGPIVNVFAAETSCGTAPKIVDGSSVAMLYRGELAVVDTVTGDVRTTVLAPGDDSLSGLGDLFDLGDAYLVSHRSMSAEGVAGPTALSRVDASTLEVTARAEVPGTISIAGDQILAAEYGEPAADGTMDEPTVLALDPVTLTTMPVEEKSGSTCPGQLSGAVTSGNLIWRTDLSGHDGAAVVTGFDSDSCELVARATLPALEAPTDEPISRTGIVAVGDDVYVISSLSDQAADYDSPPLVTVLDRIVVE